MDSLYRFDSAQRMTASVPRSDTAPAWVSGYESEELWRGIRVARLDFRCETAHHMRGEGVAVLSIAIFLDGGGTMAVDGGPSLDIRPATTVVFHAPHDVAGEHRIAAGTHVRCVEFRYSPAMVRRLGMPTLSALIRKPWIDCSIHDVLMVAQPSPPVLEELARAVFDCPLTGAARRLFLRGKALETLARIVAATDSLGDEETAAGLGRRDRQRVMEAVAILAARYREPWTIQLLARTVGLNTRKLTSGFRTIVGRSVQKHLEAVRLETAARLLEAEETSVTEVALAVGYENLSYFAKRFRDRYGASPSRWRNARP